MRRILVVLALSVAIFASAQSIKELTTAANGGNAEAAYMLGCMYFEGNNVPWNTSIAVDWWTKAANVGHTKAMERLAICYEEGKGVTKDWQKSKYWFDKGAAMGNPFCQYHVGTNYLDGLRGYEQNTTLSENFFVLAITNDNQDKRIIAKACSSLFVIYSVLHPDKEKEFYWLKRAADETSEESFDELEDVNVLLGERYIKGEYPNSLKRPNYLQAFNYFSKAAKLGSKKGLFYVGECYKNAWGVSFDCDSALSYYNQAASKDLPEACYALGDMYLGKGSCGKEDIKQAVFWFERAPYESVESLVVIGKYYQNSNYTKAYDYFSRAVERYNTYYGQSDEGLKYLSWCLMYGRGTTQNLPQAYSHITQYLKNHPNDPEAQLYLGNYYMIINQKDSATFMMNKVLASIPKNELQDEEIYRYVFNITDNAKNKKTSVSKISDVDKNIPINVQNNDKTFVVVIANEDYEEVASVPFALNDGKIFASYCQKTLGIPESNIHLVENATLNKLKREIDWLSQVLGAYNGDAKAIFYYAGHGIPDEKNHDAFLLPVDGYGNDINTGYQISKLYQQLGAILAKQVVVLMDACFSGAKREGGMLVSARGVAIKVNNGQPTGNMVVLTAAQGDETAYPNNEEGHGMFTYFLLKKLQESKGNVNLMELGDFVKTNVSQKSIILNGKSQTPSINVSAQVGDSWKSWTLK